MPIIKCVVLAVIALALIGGLIANHILQVRWRKWANENGVYWM